MYQVAISAENTTMPAPTPGMRMMTPEELAVQSYNSGVSHRDKGRKAEQQLSTAKDSDRAKLQKKATEEYSKALKDYKKATELNPGLYQAYNGMGFAYRKLDDYVKALEFYDKALQLAPGFPEALEYRGEAYLGLDRIEDAKNAYLQLLGADRAQAAILMTAMKDWLTKRRANPTGVDPASLSAFESWITERGEVAKLTASMGYTGKNYGW
jgi:tetratricopeptide (TPR) repeat protein